MFLTPLDQDKDQIKKFPPLKLDKITAEYSTSSIVTAVTKF